MAGFGGINQFADHRTSDRIPPHGSCCASGWKKAAEMGEQHPGKIVVNIPPATSPPFIDFSAGQFVKTLY